MHRKITPNLWFDGNVEQAADFYVSVFPDSRITSKTHYPEGLHRHVVLEGTDEIFRDPARARPAFEAMQNMRKLDIAALRAAADGAGG